MLFKGRRVLALWMGLCAVTMPVLAEEMPGDAAYTTAAALVQSGKWAEAVPALEKFLSVNPRHAKAPEARLRLGDALLELKKPAEAEKQFAAVLEGKPADPVRAGALFGLARVHAARDESAAAVKALDEAFGLTEYDDRLGPRVALLLGELHFAAERYADAARAYYRVTRWVDFPEAPRAFFQLAESHRLAGSTGEAAVAYRTLAERYWRDPLAPKAALAAGEAYLVLEKPSEAEAEFRRILRLYTDEAQAPRAQLGLGRVALARGDYEVARAAFEAAGVIFARAGIGPEAQLRIADSYLAEKNAAEARKRYQALLDDKDRVVAGEARFTLARLEMEDRKLPAAAEHYAALAADRAAGSWSDLGALRLAEIRIGSGDLPAAIALLKPVAGGKGEPELRDQAALQLADLHLRREEWKEAAAAVAPLAGRGGAAGRAAGALLARASLEQGDARGALERADALLKDELEPPHRAAMLAIRGRAQLRLDRPEEAVASLSELLEKHPGSPDAPEAARVLLNHYRDTRQSAKAEAVEELIATRFKGTVTLADGVLEQGEKLLRDGKPAEAAALFNQALAQKPDRAARLRARAGLAELAVVTRRPAELEDQLKQIAADAPSPAFDAALQLRLGTVYEKAADRTAALAAYRRALSPEAGAAIRVDAALGAARLLSAQGKAAEAETLLKQALESKPSPAQTGALLYALGWAALDQGRAEAARPSFERLVSELTSHPLAADASFRLGELEYAAGRFAEAAEHYRRAAGAAGAAAPAAAYKLGWALRRLGDHERAAETFAALAFRFPKHPLAVESRVRAAEAFLQLEKDRHALEQLEPLLKGSTGETPAVELVMQAKVGAALAYLMQGELDRARALAEEVGVPANGWYGARAHLLKAETLFLKDGPKKALPEYLRSATLFGRFPEVAAEASYRAGECYEKLGDPKAAQETWQRVVDLYGESTWAARSREKLQTRSSSQK
ncbi:MAG: tetratricopeptide repeat protein [Armatimonadota bacterium]